MNSFEDLDFFSMASADMMPSPMHHLYERLKTNFDIFCPVNLDSGDLQEEGILNRGEPVADEINCECEKDVEKCFKEKLTKQKKEETLASMASYLQASESRWCAALDALATLPTQPNEIPPVEHINLRKAIKKGKARWQGLLNLLDTLEEKSPT